MRARLVLAGATVAMVTCLIALIPAPPPESVGGLPGQRARMIGGLHVPTLRRASEWLAHSIRHRAATGAARISPPTSFRAAATLGSRTNSGASTPPPRANTERPAHTT